MKTSIIHHCVAHSWTAKITVKFHSKGKYASVCVCERACVCTRACRWQAET